MEKVSRELAQKEIQKWIDYKKLSERKVEENKAEIELLVDAIVDGTIVIDENLNIIQTLKMPLKTDDGNSVMLQTLKFKPRLSIMDVRNRSKNNKANDFFGIIVSYVSALTETNSGLIDRLDTEDFKIGQSIAGFFM